MLNILIGGALGRMGKKVLCATLEDVEATAVCGVDLKEDLSNANFPVYSSYECVKEKVDVIIDFSSPLSLDNILEYSLKNNVPAVLCATGYTPEQIKKIEETSKKVALFRSANMSLGVNVLIELVKEAAKSLYGFDVEIVEAHHNKKVDAPSGTALMLADAVKSVDNEKFFLYGREGVVGKRTEKEIGIHAVRGGTVVGEHDVMFLGEQEKVTLSHQATDRSVFAIGAVKAAKYLATKKNGLYNMADVLKNA